jgi:hypothetical protein
MQWNDFTVCEISGSHGGEYDVWGLLGCFRGAYCLPHLEAVRTSETSVNFNVMTRRYIQEDSELRLHSRSDTMHDNMRIYPSYWLGQGFSNVSAGVPLYVI